MTDIKQLISEFSKLAQKEYKIRFDLVGKSDPLRILRMIKNLVDFDVPVNFRVKIRIKRSEKIDKYLDFVWEQKELWNMKVVVILIIVSAFGTVLKGSEKELVETRDQRKNRAHPKHCTLKIRKNT